MDGRVGREVQMVFVVLIQYEGGGKGEFIRHGRTGGFVKWGVLKRIHRINDSR